MNADELSQVVDHLVSHWRDAPQGGDVANQPVRLLAQGIVRSLPAALSDRVRAAPDENRQLIAAALERLEERDPSTRELLRLLVETSAPGVGPPATVPFPLAQPRPGATPTRTADQGAAGGTIVFNQGFGLQAGRDISGVFGSGNTFGAGSAFGAGAIGGANQVGGNAVIGGSGTIGSSGAFPAPRDQAAAHGAPVPSDPATPLSPVDRLAASSAATAGAASTSSITILFVGANPLDTGRLRLDEEVRDIDTALRQGSLRDCFNFKQHFAVRMLDLQQALLLHRPQILHFSGHGSSQQAIFLEDDSGHSLAVNGVVLARLLSLFRQHLRCVVLNACYSADQAQAIAQYIDCVVGMTTAVGDHAAIHFAAAFYQALAFGADVQTAFELGCTYIQPTSPGEENTPKLLALRLKPSEIVFSAR